MDHDAARKRHLSSLQRGLAALSVLNQETRISAAELAERVGIPRTSAHRILHTLMHDGYVTHDPHSRRYTLSGKVLALSPKAAGELPIAAAARPILRRLCKKVLNPVGLATLVGCSAVIQVSLDHEAPLALRRLPEGTAFPVTYPPTGHLFLAFASEARRRELTERPPASVTERPLFRAPAPSAEELANVRAQGFALAEHHNPSSPECVLAAPVLIAEELAATIHLRFARRALTRDEALAAYLQPMQAAAVEIAAAVASAPRRRGQARDHHTW